MDEAKQLRSRRPIAIALAGAAGLLLAVGLGIGAMRDTDLPQIQRQAPDVLGQPPGGVEEQLSRDEGPLLYGTKMGLAEAADQMGGSLLRPNHELASDASIRNVYVETATDDETGVAWSQAALDYVSGVVLTIWPVEFRGSGFAEDAEQQYAEMAKVIGSRAQVQTIQGVPALVIEAGSGPDQPAAVDIVLGDMRAQLIAAYSPLSAADLVAIAETFK